MKGIQLVNDTIDKKDINSLIKWLKTYPRLTKGDLTKEFEEKWSEHLGVKYSVYVNSGSSANLAMIYALKCRGKLKSNKIIVPAVSWSTTVAPVIQLGFEPIFCDCDKDTLGLDPEHLKDLLCIHDVCAVVVVHALGIPAKMKEIKSLCKKNKAVLLEDSCESVNSMYRGKKTGTFGLMSTFSFYFGHHMSCSPDTPIPYLKQNGEYHINSIENIYDEYNKNPNEIKLSVFDNNTHKISFKQPQKILKHKLNNKQILRITLKNCRHVDITEDHSVFVWDKELMNIVPKEGDKITVNDLIVIPKRLPSPPLKTELNFIEYCKQNKKLFCIINYDKKNLQSIKPFWKSKEAKQKSNYQQRKILPLEHLIYPDNENKIAFKNTPKNKYIPVKYKITPDLCRVIGFFIAEGSFKKDYGLSFAFHKNEIEYIEDVKNNIYKIFGINGYVSTKDNCSQVCFDSKILAYFFESFLGIKRGARKKRIPNIIYTSSDICKISYLYGHFMGDGTYNKHRISVASGSYKLINDTSYLFSMLGIRGSIVKTNKKEIIRFINKKQINSNDVYSFRLYNLMIYKNGTIKKIDINRTSGLEYYDSFKIPIYSKRKKGYVEYYSFNSIKKHFPKAIEKDDGLLKLKNADLSLKQIKKIEKINPDYKYVYDFSVHEDENFIGGYQPICLHNSTIEGGMVCTNNKELYNTLLMLRSHGWDRDLDQTSQKKLRKKHKVSDYKSLYTFYHPSFNLRATDLQAFIGLRQMDKIDDICSSRFWNFDLYDIYLENDYWKIPYDDKNYVSNFAYPIIHPKRDEISKALFDAGIENRPLICGNMANQPFCIQYSDPLDTLEFADIVDKYGMYVPNHPGLTETDIIRICEIINGVINDRTKKI